MDDPDQVSVYYWSVWKQNNQELLDEAFPLSIHENGYLYQETLCLWLALALKAKSAGKQPGS